MEGMDNIDHAVKLLFKAKAERRRVLARLSFPEKVRIVVKMQKMSYPLARKRTARACIWKID